MLTFVSLQYSQRNHPQCKLLRYPNFSSLNLWDLSTGPCDKWWNSSTLHGRPGILLSWPSPRIFGLDLPIKGLQHHISLPLNDVGFSWMQSKDSWHAEWPRKQYLSAAQWRSERGAWQMGKVRVELVYRYHQCLRADRQLFAQWQPREIFYF